MGIANPYTGVLVDKAQDLIVRPPLTDEDLYRRFVATVKDAHRYGLTSIHDAGFSPVSVEFFSRQVIANEILSIFSRVFVLYRQANKAPLPVNSHPKPV
jgi:predicted amidohydrolase YtcJ